MDNLTYLETLPTHLQVVMRTSARALTSTFFPDHAWNYLPTDIRNELSRQALMEIVEWFRAGQADSNNQRTNP